MAGVVHLSPSPDHLVVEARVLDSTKAGHQNPMQRVARVCINSHEEFDAEKPKLLVLVHAREMHRPFGLKPAAPLEAPVGPRPPNIRTFPKHLADPTALDAKPPCLQVPLNQPLADPAVGARDDRAHDSLQRVIANRAPSRQPKGGQVRSHRVAMAAYSPRNVPAREAERVVATHAIPSRCLIQRGTFLIRC